jgi:hypothetical protein
VAAVGATNVGASLSYPNREKRASQVLRGLLVAVLLISVGLMLAVAIGGWSKLQGLTPIDFAWCVAYLLIAYRVTRWARGSLPIAAALSVLMLTFVLVAAFTFSGASWDDRARPGYARAQTLFGGTGLSAHTLQTLAIALACAQILLLIAAMRAFSQRWNIERELLDTR